MFATAGAHAAASGPGRSTRIADENHDRDRPRDPVLIASCRATQETATCGFAYDLVADLVDPQGRVLATNLVNRFTYGATCDGASEADYDLPVEALAACRREAAQIDGR
jgi:hypothetical protein